jgi:hypothetical protein
MLRFDESLSRIVASIRRKRKRKGQQLALQTGRLVWAFDALVFTSEVCSSRVVRPTYVSTEYACRSRQPAVNLEEVLDFSL